FVFFFFSSRRRHTRSDRDWSSDVCSSDLIDWLLSLTWRVVRTTPGTWQRVWERPPRWWPPAEAGPPWPASSTIRSPSHWCARSRSEERRVGKEWRSGWGGGQCRKMVEA